MRVYELALVLRSSFSQVQRKKVVDAIKNLLKDLKVTKETEIGEKPLSYKIKKEDTGYYMDFLFEGNSIPMEFEKKLLANEDVLRHLLIRKK
ncbi:MAG: 30S ribosomal protein S6 [Patescibacteria group bacterium]